MNPNPDQKVESSDRKQKGGIEQQNGIIENRKGKQKNRIWGKFQEGSWKVLGNVPESATGLRPKAHPSFWPDTRFVQWGGCD